MSKVSLNYGWDFLILPIGRVSGSHQWCRSSGLDFHSSHKPISSRNYLDDSAHVALPSWQWFIHKKHKISTSAFRRGLCHFCLSCKAGTYSFNHLFQKWSAKICACRHFFLTKISSFTKDPGGKAWTGLCSNRWFGVKGSQSFGSSEAGESGLEFKIDSTSVRTVVNTSSSTRLFARIAFRAVRVLRISLSQTPLACEALGGWNTHWHPFWSSSSWICFWFQSSTAVVISLSAPTKLDPLSE